MNAFHQVKCYSFLLSVTGLAVGMEKVLTHSMYFMHIDGKVSLAFT